MATIIIKNSTGSNAVPSSLIQGELAINTVTGKLYYGSGSTNDVKEFTGSAAFPYTGSAIITGSLIVTGSTTSTLGFTGSLFGTASWASSASQALISSQTISASLAATASTVIVSPLVPSTAYIVGTGVTGGGEKTLNNNIFSYTTATQTINATSSWANSASYAIVAQTLLGSVTSASFASTASFVNTLNQNVIITGSTAIGTSSLGSTENTLALGPPPAGGTGEGGQLLLQAPGGSYTSASMIDNYQNTFRILRGTNASSDASLFNINLQTNAVTTAGNVNGATPTEMSYLSGVTSAIQTQLNSKAAQDSISLINNTSVTIGTSTTSYVSFCAFTTNSAEANRQIVVPVAGTVKNLYVLTSTTQSVGGSQVCTVRKNGVNTSVVVTIGANAAAGVFSDTSNSFSVAAGDKLGLQVQNNAATGTAATIVSVAIIIERT